MKAIHKFLGEVTITEACVYLQKQNADSWSIFVEHEGEIKEVSKALITQPTTQQNTQNENTTN